MGDNCISLSGSAACPAFSSASVSKSDEVVSKFPFLQYVSNTEDFDEKINSYVRNDYVQTKYQQQFGCDGINLSNTTYLYARYTKSVICNGIVQESKTPCSLSDEDAQPLCADTCADAATGQQSIAVNSDLCGSPDDGYMDKVRADFTVCSMPADSLSGECVSGSDNEPRECGFGSNLLGLCTYCASSSPNSTDSCCAGSDAAERCADVNFPSAPTLPPLFPSGTPTSSAEPTDGAASGGGLSGGQIAGAVVGSVAGLSLLIALVVFLVLFMRRKRSRDDDTVFNQPSPRHASSSAAAAMQQAPGSRKDNAYDVFGGGRVARMSALESGREVSPPPRAAGAAGKYNDSSDSEAYNGTPANKSRRPPPITSRRNGSLSSTSVLHGEGDTMSPNSGSGGQFSSPEGVTSQSEQLPYFRDYYSQDDIHPNDKVAVLWAYQPRAGDEFELQRGDMLKVVGIWDDGWATGVLINERAEDYEGIYRPQRDSGVSNGSGRRGSSPPPTGEIKAFPLVCVCLPEHWKKTIDGDLYDDAGPSSPP